MPADSPPEPRNHPADERGSDRDVGRKDLARTGPKTRLKTLADVDRRTRAAQDAFRLRDNLAADLGGWDGLSAMKRELVENAAVLGAMLKDAAACYLSGRPVDLAEYMALTNAQRRLLADLGLERSMLNATPLTGHALVLDAHTDEELDAQIESLRRQA